MEFAPHIPDHELLRCIGRGAYGGVWLARNVTGAYRAVKIVYRSSFDHDRPYEREFSGIQKYEPVSRTHETQVNILHVGRNNAAGYFYYIMELADDRLTGQDINPDRYEPWTLHSHLEQNGRLPIEECLDIGLHLAGALEYIHKNGLVHRDVKPSNIIFVNAVPKLADIGLVTGSDATRSFVGTEGYIPPEGPGSPQADIYSLGKVLYEISTGRNRLDFPELPTLLKDLPEREALVQLNEVILIACDEDPTHRYQTAGEMLKDLWTLKSGKPLRGNRRRGRTIKVLGASMLIVTVTIIGGAAIHWERTREGIRPNRNQFSAAMDAKDVKRGLISWWQADDNALDSMHNNNGTIHGTVSFADGPSGEAFSFDGGYVEIPDSPTLRFNGPFSISLWIRVRGYENYLAAIITKGDHSWRLQRDFRGHSVLFSITGVNHSRFDGHPPFDLPASRVVDDGQWHHVAAVYDGENETIYIDGTPDISVPCSGIPSVDNAPVLIGENSDDLSRSLNGQVSDLRIYDRALSAAEIKVLATTNHAGVNIVGSSVGKSRR